MTSLSYITKQGEIWLPVSEYPKYLVSNIGRVFNTVVRKGKGRIVKQALRNNDRQNSYLRVMLSDDNFKQTIFNVHRLVCQTFVENPLDLLTVDHIDRNTTNNTVSNLRWCTQRQQSQNRSKKILQKKSAERLTVHSGVSWHKNDKKWQTSIQIDDKNYGLGNYDNEYNAAAVVNFFRYKYYKEFAVLNDVHWRSYNHPEVRSAVAKMCQRHNL